MINELLQSIVGVEIYPIISLVLFLSIFLIVVWWAIRMDKKRVLHLSNLPLENDHES